MTVAKGFDRNPNTMTQGRALRAVPHRGAAVAVGGAPDLRTECEPCGPGVPGPQVRDRGESDQAGHIRVWCLDGVDDTRLIGAEHCCDVVDLMPIRAQKARRMPFGCTEGLAEYIKPVQDHPSHRVTTRSHGFRSFMAMICGAVSGLVAESGARMFTASGFRGCSGPLARATTSGQAFGNRAQESTTSKCSPFWFVQAVLPAAGYFCHAECRNDLKRHDFIEFCMGPPCAGRVPANVAGMGCFRGESEHLKLHIPVALSPVHRTNDHHMVIA